MGLLKKTYRGSVLFARGRTEHARHSHWSESVARTHLERSETYVGT